MQTSPSDPCSRLVRVLPKQPMHRQSRPDSRTLSIAPATTPQRHRWTLTSSETHHIAGDMGEDVVAMSVDEILALGEERGGWKRERECVITF